MFDDELKEHMSLFNKLHIIKQSVEKLSKISVNTLEQGGKLIFAGNGGSAADAQHIATEFTVKFKEKRVALPAIALTTDTSALTAIGTISDLIMFLLGNLRRWAKPEIHLC